MDEQPTAPPPSEPISPRPDVTEPTGSASEVPTAPVRHRWIPIAAAAIGAALVAGGVLAFVLLRGSGEALFDQVPASADVVAAVYLDPAASQKVNLFRIAERFPELGSRDEVIADVDDAMDDVLAELGLTHEDLGWVGVEVAVWADLPAEGDPLVALLVDSDDDAGARTTMDRLVAYWRDQGSAIGSVTHDGVEIYSADPEQQGALAYADHTMIVGSSVDAVIATIDVGRGDGESIETSPIFLDAMEDLPEARLAVSYVGFEGTAAWVQRSAGMTDPNASPVDFAGTQSVGTALSVTDEGIVVDVSTVNDPSQMAPEVAAALDEPSHDNPALAIVPGNAFGVVAVELDIDAYVEEAIGMLEEQDPLLADDLEDLGITGPDGIVGHLTGDLAFEASPGDDDPVAGAVLVGVDDPDAVGSFIDDTMTELAGEVPAWIERDHRGITMRSLDDDVVPLTYAFVDGMLAIGSGPEHVASVIDVARDGGGLDQDEGFTGAMSGIEASDSLMFVDVPAILQVARDQLPPEEVASFEDEVGRHVDPIGHIVMGMEGDASRQHMRMFVEIR